MKITKLIIIFSLFNTQVFAENSIPDWFIDDLKKNIGVWTTDNSAYKSENEPQDSYVMDWQWGIGKTSITGRLYGVVAGKNTEDYWHFRQYWDNQKQTAMLIQYGLSGIIGVGDLKLLNDGNVQAVQEFSTPNGQKWLTKHLTGNDGKILNTSSYNQDKKGNWVIDRSYIWGKQNNNQKKRADKINRP